MTQIKMYLCFVAFVASNFPPVLASHMLRAFEPIWFSSTDTRAQVLLSFCHWWNTVEGAEFWSAMHKLYVAYQSPTIAQVKEVFKKYDIPFKSVTIRKGAKNK